MKGTQTQHTPGPWRLAESAVEQWIAGTTPEGAPDQIVCDRPHFEMEQPGKQERWEADARLIICAVNSHESLLAAAKAALPSIGICLSLLERYADKLTGSESQAMRAILPSTIAELEAAIRAAEGGR